jgi:hypothetical protein
MMNETELRERAIRLLHMRAGGRYTSFESGMLYQICLDLGMKDERKGGIGAQERYWEQIVCSCWTDQEANEVLDKLLRNKRVPTRKERSLMRKKVAQEKTK